MSSGVTDCGLLAVFHELCEVEDGLSDLWNVLQCQRLLQVGHQILLVDWSGGPGGGGGGRGGEGDEGERV